MQAYYYDGKVAKRWECSLTLHAHSLTITYQKEEGETLTEVWEPERIGKLDVKSSQRTLKYGDFPHQVLEFKSSEDFDTFINRYPEADFHQSSFNAFQTWGWTGMAGAVAGVIVLALVFYVYGVPLLADTFAQTIPREYESAMGANIRDSYLEYQTVDSVKSQQIQKFYDHLGYASPYEVHVAVVDAPVVNAFALPGGYIVVYTGILDRMDNETELAALLAHEVSHVNEQHSLRLLSRDLAKYVLLASLTGDVGGFTSVLIENSDMITSLSHSRKFEKQADLEGLLLMQKAHIDPHGMVTLFEKFEHAHQNESDVAAVDSLTTDVEADSTQSWKNKTWSHISDLLSTHPSPENRIRYLKAEIENSQTQWFESNDSLRYYFDRLKE